ncbi:MAG: TlpA family protein disulfide reductase [Luteitalea sp.]
MSTPGSDGRQYVLEVRAYILRRPTMELTRRGFLIGALGGLVLGAGTRPGAGGAATALTLPSLAGEAVSLAQYRGRIVLVNFWATWCVPCRVEMPWLLQLQKEFGRDLAVLGVAMDEDAACSVPPFVQRYGLTFPILLGNEAVANAFTVEAMPATFLLDRKGAQVQRVDGPFHLEAMRRAIQALRARP